MTRTVRGHLCDALAQVQCRFYEPVFDFDGKPHKQPDIPPILFCPMCGERLLQTLDVFERECQIVDNHQDPVDGHLSTIVRHPSGAHTVEDRFGKSENRRQAIEKAYRQWVLLGRSSRQQATAPDSKSGDPPKTGT